MTSTERETQFNIIFVGGAMRTGTSLLQHTLCSTPSTNDMMFECHHLTSHVKTYAQWRNKSDRALADFFDGLEELKGFTKIQLDSLLTSIHRQQHSPRDLILKHPELTPLFPAVAELLPNAKFVIMVRDPRDVVSSMLVVAEKQKKLGRSSNMVAAQRDMKKLTHIFLSFYQSVQYLMKVARNRVMFVKYETLVTDPDQFFPDLSAFTGLDFSTFNKDADWVYTRLRGKNDSFDTKIRGRSISKDSIGNYKSSLSNEEIRQIEDYAHDFMKTFKYSLSTFSELKADTD
ncbi:MAG: sulfotransferase [Sneathiella sp.]|nr:sulfotransferase [Sneathiella sp.]